MELRLDSADLLEQLPRERARALLVLVLRVREGAAPLALRAQPRDLENARRAGSKYR